MRLTKLFPAAPLGVALVALAALAPTGCASSPPPERLTPQTMSSTPPTATEDLPEAEAAEAAAVAAEPGAASTEAAGDDAARPSSSDRLTVVIEDESTRQSRQLTLVEAAAAERERRARAGESIAVVTDKNLADFSDGQLTELDPAAGADPVPPAATTQAEQPPETPADGKAAESAAGKAKDGAQNELDAETYWRGRILRARRNWASAVEETQHLENKIAELRQRFYAEDDPYYRDAKIKPSWDRALDRLEEARAAIDRYRLEVQTVLEEGRRASALPGWLREGLDLEPDPLAGRPEDGPSPPTEYLPGEPKVAADPDGRRR